MSHGFAVEFGSVWRDRSESAESKQDGLLNNYTVLLSLTPLAPMCCSHEEGEGPVNVKQKGQGMPTILSPPAVAVGDDACGIARSASTDVTMRLLWFQAELNKGSTSTCYSLSPKPRRLRLAECGRIWETAVSRACKEIVE